MVVYEVCPICNSKKIKAFLPVKDYFLTQEDFELWKCETCSFVFTHALEDEDNIGKYYKSEEYISHSDKKKGFFICHMDFEKPIDQQLAEFYPKKLIETATAKAGFGGAYFVSKMGFFYKWVINPKKNMPQ